MYSEYDSAYVPEFSNYDAARVGHCHSSKCSHGRTSMNAPVKCTSSTTTTPSIVVEAVMQVSDAPSIVVDAVMQAAPEPTAHWVDAIPLRMVDAMEIQYVEAKFVASESDIDTESDSMAKDLAQQGMHDHVTLFISDHFSDLCAILLLCLLVENLMQEMRGLRDQKTSAERAPRKKGEEEAKRLAGERQALQRDRRLSPAFGSRALSSCPPLA